MNPGLDCARLAEAAQAAGLVFLGVLGADAAAEAPGADAWFAAGRHADMDWLARNQPKRLAAGLVMEGARSVLVFAMAFSQIQIAQEELPGGSPGAGAQAAGTPAQGRIASYASGKDYHALLRQRIRQCLMGWEGFSGAHRILVDANPLSERSWARLTGRGFIGRNTMFIIPELGEAAFLGTVLCEREYGDFIPEPPRAAQAALSCPPDCRLCVDACPNGALSLEQGEGCLDARLCLSWQSIESRGGLPAESRRAFADRLFGCDACLAACPYQMRLPSPWRLDLAEALAIQTDPAFCARFAGTTVLRAGLRNWLINAMSAALNSRGAAALPEIAALRAHPDEAVAQAACELIDTILGKHG